MKPSIITSLLNRLKLNEFVPIIVLIIFHTVGIFSLFSESYRATILPLSALNLLLAYFILAHSFKAELSKFLLFSVLCFITGFIYEYIGVHTGLLFGSYQYGENLGLKLDEIPIIIGVNWCLLVVSASVISNIFTTNIYFKALFASLLMTLLDFLIEPVAISSDFWNWNTSYIPIYNYVCWFLLSLPLNFLFTQFKFKEQNRVAVCLYLIFVCFFSILNFY